MSISSSAKQALIQQIVTALPKREGVSETLLKAFTQTYYNVVSLDDLRVHPPETFAAMAASIFEFASARRKKDAKVRAYNPTQQKHGWRSQHTIIEISSQDMPFIVDSVSAEVLRQGYEIHFTVHMGGLPFVRGERREIEALKNRESLSSEHYESLVHLEIDKQTDKAHLRELEQHLRRVLSDVRMAVEDWPQMRQKMEECIQALSEDTSGLDSEEITEARDFLSWLLNDHFVFLGCRDYCYVDTKGKEALHLELDSGLGVLRDTSKSRAVRPIEELSDEAKKTLYSKQVLVIGKTNTISTVHRRNYTDDYAFKFFKNGKLVGERRFVGLNTSSAYNRSPRYIPFLRNKVSKVMNKTGLLMAGHAAKAILHILETLPRDDLFQASVEELYELSQSIYHLQERRRIRLFVRKDIYGHFYSCLVFIPRDHYSAELRESMGDFLSKEFHALSYSHHTMFTESALARIHFIFRVTQTTTQHSFDFVAMEKRLVDIARTWIDDLRSALLGRFGEEKGAIYCNRYLKAFPASYCEFFSPDEAVKDIQRIEALEEENPLLVALEREEGQEGTLCLKILQYAKPCALSDVFPMLKHFGFSPAGEKRYYLNFSEGKTIWLHHFTLEPIEDLDFVRVKANFEEAFLKTWNHLTESDAFNQLVLTVGLDWREVNLIRTYCAYFKQIGLRHTSEHFAEIFSHHPELTALLVQLFSARFEKAATPTRKALLKTLEESFFKALHQVHSLEQDKLFRLAFKTIQATLRTNYFQRSNSGESYPYLSLKLSPQSIPGVPKPYPEFEIFVYAIHFEGVHLRADKVARGGLRWSDRRNDFRTEILGLMKAQQVKNTVIVPQGAKGGFVTKMLPLKGTRDELMAEVLSCYQDFIRALLQITDNWVEGKIQKPRGVVSYDEDDPYLVVAADKGTATFSDAANSVAKECGFWLGDAFASGGSVGYDHKKMGITARGAWCSVIQHCRELGLNPESDPITVLAIGDMSGDVFGNGMLLSSSLKLQFAFNHLHIFIDPNPNPEKSYQERRRLFDLPRSSWSDYTPKLISKGGGVFERSAKYIKLTPEMKTLLSVSEDYLSPDDLIRVILKTPVDLFWNGGIGTYVKASTERHEMVGDPANNAVRINGSELGARLVGEGGNLGFTQLGRVEFSEKGGLIFADFIDNSAGVDCSDAEVNIKIFLNQVLAQGQITPEKRNRLLAEMEPAVAIHVLQNNRLQTRLLAREVSYAKRHMAGYMRYIAHLEQAGILNRDLDGMPSEKALALRNQKGEGLTRPELAILCAHTKNQLRAHILEMGIAKSDEFEFLLKRAFPDQLLQTFPGAAKTHQLAEEIIATQLSNSVVNEMGLLFIERLKAQTGASLLTILRAYCIVSELFELASLHEALNERNESLSMKQQFEMTLQINRFLKRACHWLVSNRSQLDIAVQIKQFSGLVTEFLTQLPHALPDEKASEYAKALERYKALGFSGVLLQLLSGLPVLFPCFDILQGALDASSKVKEFAGVFYGLEQLFSLSRLRERIRSLPVHTYWESLARSNFWTDLDTAQSKMSRQVITETPRRRLVQKRLEDWSSGRQDFLNRWNTLFREMEGQDADYIQLYTMVRELSDFSESFTSDE